MPLLSGSHDAACLLPPVLDTPRLILEGHPLGDFEALAAMWAEPKVVEHIFNGKPSAPRDSWMRMLAYRGLWPLLGYGYWAIREKASGRYVGDLGFADFHRVIEPSIRGVPEAGCLRRGRTARVTRPRRSRPRWHGSTGSTGSSAACA